MLKMVYQSYFRPEIDAMAGYTPGEQPKQVSDLIKLNTNENPYPPAPGVSALLRNLDVERLRLYPEPLADTLRDIIADLNGVQRDNIIAGNGSDDILTIVTRCFCDSKRTMACIEPTYSLYPVLAGLQGAECRRIDLNADFSLPEDLVEQARGANILMIARPNAPTGNSFPKALMEKVCREFHGIVFIDEAYADFADDNCVDLAMRYDNVIVSRTMSKSYALAGARLGYAIAAAPIIAGMMKMKDSYNVNMLTQKVAAEAFLDRAYLAETVKKIRATRERTFAALTALGFDIVPSAANFLFAAPPDGNGALYFDALRKHNIIVRFFPGPKTARYVRISIGTDAAMDRVLEVARELYG